jgi:hypothetical protein
MITEEKFIGLVENLTGQKSRLLISSKFHEPENPFLKSGLGYSQFNEVLLSLGYNRVSYSFFQYLVNGDVKYSPKSQIESYEQFEDGINRFRSLAILFFGSIIKAYSTLSQDEGKLSLYIYSSNKIDEDIYKVRHAPIIPIDTIPPEHTYYLGYIVKSELERKKAVETSAEIEDELKLLEETREKGKRNHEAYLASDILDVYVATSMRLKHEYVYVNRITKEIFNHETLKPFNLRYFDPTQAYCEERIDKGLSEALMLKRAKCTIYLAQESDTLGKDSELASTLAQGKPVIAFVPFGDECYLNTLYSDIKQTMPTTHSNNQILLEMLKLISPHKAWTEPNITELILKPEKIDEIELKKIVAIELENHYNKRAEILKDQHPLGIQVNLETGVANGVLVVRRIEDCVQLLKDIFLRSLRFNFKTDVNNGKTYHHLIETISDCSYRIITGDDLLTNSFWNYYFNG